MSGRNTVLATVTMGVVAATLLSSRAVRAFIVVPCAGFDAQECMENCRTNAGITCGDMVRGATYCPDTGFVCAPTKPPRVYWEGTAKVTCCKDGVIVGDPHFKSLDGLFYDFQAVGEFVLLNSNLFALQVRQEAQGRCAAVAVAAASRIGANRIMVHARETPPLSIDGAPTRIPCALDADGAAASIPAECSCSGTLALPDGIVIENSNRDGNTLYTVRSPDTGDHVVINVRRAGYLDISVRLGTAGQASATGLLGSPDGDLSNDLRTRDGRLMPQPITFHQLYREFGDSWRVSQEESLFDYGPDESTETFTDRDFPVAPCALVQDDAKRSAAEKVCRSGGVTDEAMLRACTFDVTSTGDKRFVESYVGLSAPTAALTMLEDGTESGDGGASDLTLGGAYGCDCNLSANTPHSVWPCLVVGAAVLRRWTRGTRSPSDRVQVRGQHPRT